MLTVFTSALLDLFQWSTLAVLLTGVCIGTIVAFLPGMGATTGLALLLPFALSTDMDPLRAIVLLLAAYSVMNSADSVMAILFGIPGGSSAQALVMDGYPMTQQGRAGEALGASFTASAIGGLVGAFAVLVAVPLVIPLIRVFGSPELLVLALWGISMVGLLSRGSQAKGLGAGLLGLLLGTIGIDPQRGIARYAMGLRYLWDGLPIVIVGLALFATPQIIQLIRRKALVTGDVDESYLSYRQVFSGVRQTLRHKFLVLRSCVLGVFVGVLPGVGGSVVDWLVYGQTVQTSKDRSRFGQGDIRGVIGPDSATNAVQGGALIPTIAFAIPGGIAMAIILAALLALDVTPGVQMLTTSVDLTYTMVWVMVLANVIAAGALLALSPLLLRVTLLPAPVLVSVVLTFSVLGSLMSNQLIQDVVLFTGLSVLGYLMMMAGWPRAPVLLGFVLSRVLERYLFISLNAYGWSWVLRPTVLVLLALVGGSYAYLARKGPSSVSAAAVAGGRGPERPAASRLAGAGRESALATGRAGGEPAPASGGGERLRRDPRALLARLRQWPVLFSLLLGLTAAWLAWAATDLRYEARLFPLILAVALALLACTTGVVEVVTGRISRSSEDSVPPRPAGAPPPAPVRASPGERRSRPWWAAAESSWPLGLAWFLMAVAPVIAAGPRFGLPVGVYLCAKIPMGQGHLRSGVLALAALSITSLFDAVFDVLWPGGLIL